MGKIYFFFCILIMLPVKTAKSEVFFKLNGEALIHGSIVSSACSIETDSYYQYINYETVTNDGISGGNRELARKNFYIKLKDCLSEYDNGPYKGVRIQFLSPGNTFNNAMEMTGPETGVVLYIYDADNRLLIPNKSYKILPLLSSNDKKDNGVKVLKYILELSSFNKDVEPGNYFAIIKFKITYD
ncbi:TPA: fimbrial protein [Klebsiella aerogenes]